MKITFEDQNPNQSKNALSKSQLEAMYHKLFLSSIEGAYVLDDLAKKSGMFSITTESNNLLYKEGMRAMYLYIASHLTRDQAPDKISDYNPLS